MSDNKNVEAIQPTAPENNVYLPTELAGAILVFLERTQIQGGEAEAMVAAKATMKRLLPVGQGNG